jgi:beta-glucanase (GH16 family)
MKNILKTVLLLFLCIAPKSFAQTALYYDDFDTTGNVTWVADNCLMDEAANNPQSSLLNISAKVLRYEDNGGQYANIRFQVATPFTFQQQLQFKLKIYVPSASVIGQQIPQLALKLQNGNLAEPWTTQSEIRKPIVYDQWQEVSFNFATDTYFNLNAASVPPIQRTDFNRVVLQVNGENNTAKVTAFIDDLKIERVVNPVSAYQLIWSDDFTGNGAVDTQKWFHQTQLPAGGSWYNGEVQHYTNRQDNAFVQNGILNVVAKREQFRDQNVTKNFTSARLNSKFAFKYGKVEVSAKMPTGAGTWPAIWLLGKNISEPGAYFQTLGFGNTAWPQCGEIDIMEHWGSNQNYIQSAIHTPSSFGGTVNKGGKVIPTTSTAFHLYTMIWTPEKIDFFVNGEKYYTYNPAVKNAQTWPFDKEMYLLLNVAIEPHIAAQFTQDAMQLDYIRVYQLGTVSNDEAEMPEDNFDVYPNPFTDQITLNQAINAYKIYAIDGRLIQAENNIQTQQINGLSTLPHGLYLLETISSTGKRRIVKIIK